MASHLSSASSTSPSGTPSVLNSASLYMCAEEGMESWSPTTFHKAHKHHTAGQRDQSSSRFFRLITHILSLHAKEQASRRAAAQPGSRCDPPRRNRTNFCREEESPLSRPESHRYTHVAISVPEARAH